MKRSLIILLTCASYALAGPKADDWSRFQPVSQNIRVSIGAQGDAQGLILQAYVACLRNTPGVYVVPFGQPSDVHIEINSISMKNRAGEETGYVWAMVAIDPPSSVLLSGPDVMVVGHTNEILQQAASSVHALDRSVFINTRAARQQPSPMTPP
jgi:hypothetical protein